VIDFFRHMNFPRAVILLSLMASAVLGYFVYEKKARLAEIERELALVRTKVAKEIQQMGIELAQYQELGTGSTTGAEFDFDPYIRSIAATETLVEIGEVEISPTTKSPSKDVKDSIYKIKPFNKNKRLTRSRIGNFLYKLEADSRRVKVTSLKLTPFKKIKPGEVGEDVWTFEAAITSRSQVSG
jgi:hypothetical protein